MTILQKHIISYFRDTPKKNLYVLSLVYTVKEINKNPNILANITLGFHIYHSYYDERINYRSTLSLTAVQNMPIPNYNCDPKKTLAAVIGGLDAETSLSMTNILPIYKIPQVQNTHGVRSSYKVFPFLPLFLKSHFRKVRRTNESQI